MVRVTRTIVVRSIQLPRKMFRAFVELEGMYRNIVEQLVRYAVSNSVKSFTKLRALKYEELRKMYPQLPSHYVYTACQDAATRVKSFLRLKRLGMAEKDHPEIRRVSIWLDDHLWRLDGYTVIRVATHGGWMEVEMEPHRHYWKYMNGGWNLGSEVRMRLDKKSRRLLLYLTFRREVMAYEPSGYVPVDLNENNVTVMPDSGSPLLFETDVRDITLGYHYRRRRIQKKYGKSRVARRKRKLMRRLGEKHKRDDIRWKVANIIVRSAFERKCAIVLEKLGKNVARKMIEGIADDQLRHRIYQASFNGVQRAIEEKAKEYGVPIIYVDPRNTSRICPLHGAQIIYDNGSRIGECNAEGEIWHRDVVACWNLFFKALRGDGSDALSSEGLMVDGSPVPLGSTATHEPITLPRGLWARWKSLPRMRHTFLNKMVETNGTPTCSPSSWTRGRS